MAAKRPTQIETVVHLDGVDGFVELPIGAFDNLEAATVEAWIRWDRLYRPGIQTGIQLRYRVERLWNRHIWGLTSLWVIQMDQDEALHATTVPDVLKPGESFYVAASTGSQGIEGLLERNPDGHQRFHRKFFQPSDREDSTG